MWITPYNTFSLYPNTVEHTNGSSRSTRFAFVDGGLYFLSRQNGICQGFHNIFGPSPVQCPQCVIRILFHPENTA